MKDQRALLATPHAFMGVTKMGQAAIFETRGNADCHVILRGGKRPNYAVEDVDAACALLRAAGQREQVIAAPRVRRELEGGSCDLL